MQLLKYKYRLYPTDAQPMPNRCPTDAQEHMLWQVCGSQRYIWNYFLDLEIKQYAIDKKFRFMPTNSADLTSLKQTTHGWLKAGPSTSLQQTLRNLEKSLKQSFKSKGKTQGGFPKFKSKRHNAGAFAVTMVTTDRNIKGKRLHIPNIGAVAFTQHQDLPSDFKSFVIKHQPGSGWYVTITCQKAKQTKKIGDRSVGIDLNSREYVLSSGEVHAIPKPLRENQTKIKYCQRDIARKRKGSKNRCKALGKLQKVSSYVQRQRADYFHKLSYSLVNSYNLISIEDLDVKGIQRKYGKVIGDNGFAMFRQMLEYKCEMYGTTLQVIDRWYPSSQICSACGAINKYRLDQRTYTCRCCDLVINRDLNAAININQIGAERANLKPVDPTTRNMDKVMSILLGIGYESGSHVL